MEFYNSVCRSSPEHSSGPEKTCSPGHVDFSSKATVVDGALLELQLNGDEIYQNMVGAIENVNVIIESYKFGDFNWQVERTVAFGSGLHQWGFTLKNFARFCAAKFHTTEDQMAEKLRGDWVFATVDGKSGSVPPPAEHLAASGSQSVSQYKVSQLVAELDANQEAQDGDQGERDALA
eukprot:gene35954-44335_t